ncbi:DNA-directed RNA polymerase subunit beta, partial [Metamycoplasma alkalescens]
MFGEIPELNETLKKDKTIGVTDEEITKDSQETIYRLIRRGDRMTAESARNLIPLTLFNEKRYSLTETGRFTLNRKLNIGERLVNTYLAEDILDQNGKIKYQKGLLVNW